MEVTGIEGVTMVFSRKIPLIGGNGRIKELWVSWELLGALVLAHREVQQVESKKWRAGNGL